MSLVSILNEVSLKKEIGGSFIARESIEVIRILFFEEFRSEFRTLNLKKRLFSEEMIPEYGDASSPGK